LKSKRLRFNGDIMKEKLRRLEEVSRQLEPDVIKRKNYFDQIGRYAEHYLQNLDDKPAYQETEKQGAGLYNHPFEEEPEPLEDLLELVEQEVDTPGINTSSGRHLGYIPGGGLYPGALGDYLAAVTNRYAGIYFASPGAVRMENQLIRWLAELIGFDPEQAGGNLTSGGSLANLIGLVTARDNTKVPIREFQNMVIYATNHTHHCIHKSLNITGMHEAVMRHVPMDDGYRMDPEALQEQIEKDEKDGLWPFIVVASAGTTNVGAVDPLDKIADIAEQHNAWLHVDAAYGGFFLLCEEGRKQIRHLDRADSVIMDPHKGLFLPYGTGAVVVRDKQKLFRSQHYTADYMMEAQENNHEISPADMSPELTKHFRGLRMWLPLKLFGLKPFRAALEEKIWLARFLHRELNKIDGLETGPSPELSITFFRYVPEEGDADEFNKKLLEKIRDDGHIFLSATRIDSIYYIRAAVMSFRTHLKQIEEVLQTIRDNVEVVKKNSEMRG